MYLNSIHMRVGAIAAGVLLLAGYMMFGGSMGNEMIVQLDFSLYPELFEGSRVEIDGKLVGELKTYGQANRSGFEVNKGEHVVRIVHPEFGCEPRTVNMELPGQKTRLMLDLQELYNSSDRSSRMTIVMQ